MDLTRQLVGPRMRQHPEHPHHKWGGQRWWSRYHRRQGRQLRSTLWSDWWGNLGCGRHLVRCEWTQREQHLWPWPGELQVKPGWIRPWLRSLDYSVTDIRIVILWDPREEVLTCIHRLRLACLGTECWQGWTRWSLLQCRLDWCSGGENCRQGWRRMETPLPGKQRCWPQE